MSALDAEECVFLLQSTFFSHRFEITAFVPSYASWRLDHSDDERGALADHFRLVRFLSAGAGRLVLKAPAFLRLIESIDKIIGNDLLVVYLHRDLRTSLDSYAELLFAARSGFAPAPDFRAIAHEVEQYWTDSVAAFDDARRVGRIKAPVFDVSFESLVSNVEKVVEEIYAWAGWERRA